MNTTINNTFYGGDFNTSRSYAHTPLDNVTKKLITVIGCIIAVLSFASNAVVIYFTITRNRSNIQSAFKRSHVYYFVLSLAFSDLCTSVLAIPLNNAELWIDFVTNHWICRALRGAQIALPIITMNNLIVISVDRYLCIFRPFLVPSKRVVKRLIVGAWIAGLGSTLALVSTYKILPEVIDENHYFLNCRYDKTVPASRAVIAVFILVQYLIPCIGLSFVSLRVTKFLNKSQRNRVAPESNSNLKSESWRFRNSQMFVTLIVAFVMPYFPWFVYTGVNSTTTVGAYEDVIFRSSFGLVGFLNSLLNPIIYFTYSKEFCNRLIRTLGIRT